MQTIVGLPAYYACIALETTGVTHFTWILAELSCRACGLEENNNQTRGDDKSRREGSRILVTLRKPFRSLVRRGRVRQKYFTLEYNTAKSCTCLINLPLIL